VTAPSDDRLMRYFDGEADEAEARDIELWLESSERGRLVVSSFERVGDAVRAIGTDRGASFDVADAVMARAFEGAASAGAVVPLQRPSRRRRWASVAPALGLFFAAAAVIALYFRPKAHPAEVDTAPSVVAVASERSLPAAPEASEQVAALRGAESGAAIESVDFGAVAGTIFMVPNDSGEGEPETPVVWLMDEPADNEGRMAPL
jgi:anti-sigma factor RsiW